MSDLDRDNVAARRRATSAGRQIYQKQTVTNWPACVVCDEPIRDAVKVDKPGLYRTCGCPGVLWHSLIGSWNRLDPIEVES